MSRLMSIGDGLWTVAHPLKLGGMIALNTRMTVMRVGDGRLVLHSPVALEPAEIAEIGDLGEVAAVVAPNVLHRLFVRPCAAAFPTAAVYVAGAPGPRLSGVANVVDLASGFDAQFDGEIDRFSVDGAPAFEENVFYHVASRTLVVTDLLFHLPEAQGFTKLYASIMGVRAQPRCPPLFRWTVRDKGAFRSSLAPLRTLDVQQISMCHHQVISSGASSLLNEALDHLGVPQGALGSAT